MQAEQLFASSNFQMVNNADWLGQTKLLDFLRDIGKSFSVNAMMARDSVKDRLENREQGISYTEFSYMLLQAYDFFHLNKEYGCDWQHGSSDQWGNIISGIDLIRRQSGKTAYATTHDLLINKSTGRKFGKTEGGAVWLDPQKTSPFDFYQFWFNTDDADVEEYLLKMTMLPRTDIDAVMREQAADPASRAAQKNLAFEVTALVHGEGEAQKVAQASEDLFSGKENSETIPKVEVDKNTLLIDALSALGKSKSEMRRLAAANAITLATAGPMDGPSEYPEVFNDLNINLDVSLTVRIGKRRFIKILVK
jgi:tyrosyl-tRNA synthetase